MTLEQIEACINRTASGLTYLKEARRQAKKVYSYDKEIKFDLKIAMSDLREAVKSLEDQWND